MSEYTRMKTVGPFQSKYEKKPILEQMLVLPIFPLFDLSVMMFSIRWSCVSACNWTCVHKILEYNFCTCTKKSSKSWKTTNQNTVSIT